MRGTSFILIFCGLIVMIVATVRYWRLLRESREEAYSKQQQAHRLGTLCLVLMFLFIIGYLVGIWDTLTREVEAIYGFVAIIFFAGGCYIAIMINVHGDMMRRQRDKTLDALQTFVTAIDAKEPLTTGHSLHVYAVMALLYDRLEEPMQKRLANKPKLLDAALLHDIGKIGVPDEILKRSGRYSSEDWAAMKEHPRIGKEMLEKTCFADIGEWVMCHHERMDGKGYYSVPQEAIPLEARMLAVADTYCALRSARTYRSRRRHEEALALMIEVADTQLDSSFIKCMMLIKKEALDAVFADAPA